MHTTIHKIDLKNKDFMYNTGNNSQYLIIICNEKNLKEYRYIHRLCIIESLRCSPELTEYCESTILQLKKQADKRSHSLIKIKCWNQRRVVGEVGLEATTRGRLFLLGQQTPGRAIEQPLLLPLDPSDPASLTIPHFQPFCLSVSRC